VIAISLKASVTSVDVDNLVSYTNNGDGTASVTVNTSGSLIDYLKYIDTDLDPLVGSLSVGGTIAHAGAEPISVIYDGVTLTQTMVYQSPGTWQVEYTQSYDGIASSESNTLTITFIVRDPIKFILPGLDAEQTSDILLILGDYTAPSAYVLPTVTVKMYPSQFNDLIKLELTEADNELHRLPHPASKSLYVAENIKFHVDATAFPNLQSHAGDGAQQLKDISLKNGSIASSHVDYIDQRNAEQDSTATAILHEQALMVTGSRYMEDQVSNRVALEGVINDYLAYDGVGTDTLLGFIRAQLALAHEKTNQNDTTTANHGRELFMQVVENSVGGLDAGAAAHNDRVQRIFGTATTPPVSTAVNGKHALLFQAGDSVRFKVTFKGTQSEHLHDGVDALPEVEDRSVEFICQMEEEPQ
jgi:hypothetical protein